MFSLTSAVDKQTKVPSLSASLDFYSPLAEGNKEKRELTLFIEDPNLRDMMYPVIQISRDNKYFYSKVIKEKAYRDESGIAMQSVIVVIYAKKESK